MLQDVFIKSPEIESQFFNKLMRDGAAVFSSINSNLKPKVKNEADCNRRIFSLSKRRQKMVSYLVEYMSASIRQPLFSENFACSEINCHSKSASYDVGLIN